MARFFFHFFAADELETDDVGIEFDTAEQAYLEAIAAARSLWTELLAARRDPSRCAFEIANAAGEVLFRVPFDELLYGSHPRTTTREIQLKLHESIARAHSARNEVSAGIEQVSRSLEDFTRMMRQIEQYQKAADRSVSPGQETTPATPSLPQNGGGGIRGRTARRG